MPAPEIPKQRIPFFTWLLIGFAAVVLAGIIFSFADVADEPRPTLTDPALGTPAPGTPAPASPPAGAPAP